MKKLISLMLVVLLLSVGLIACGGNETEKSVVGTYAGDKYFYAGDPDNLLDNTDFTIELKSGGKAVCTREGTSYNGKWTMDGENITVTESLLIFENTYTGTLVDGTLTLTNSELGDDWAITYTFHKQ